MASGSRILQAYEKTSSLNVVVDSYPSVVRFIGPFPVERVASPHGEAYRMMLRLLARHAGQDPAALDEEAVRAFFLYLVRDRQYSSQRIRQARAALTSFFVEMLGRTDWAVFATVNQAIVTQSALSPPGQRLAMPADLIFLINQASESLTAR